MMIILDNGHGKDTPGKRSPVWSDGTQLFEYEFNRDIVQRIKKALPDEEIIILVPEEWDVSLPDRVRRVNSLVAKKTCNALLISIHANAGGGTGWEVWTSVGETMSDNYASDMYYEAGRVITGFPLRRDLTDGDPDKESQFYILKNTWCPAILTENLFMDNEKDCRFLMSDTGRDIIAEAHINFIKSIL